jgi:hypothetical protein
MKKNHLAPVATLIAFVCGSSQARASGSACNTYANACDGTNVIAQSAAALPVASYGENQFSDSIGVEGVATAAGNGTGVEGIGSLYGVQGYGGSGTAGVLGYTGSYPTITGPYGVVGSASASLGVGVYGISTLSHGVVGIAKSSSTAAGVVGENTSNGANSYGVYGVIYPYGPGTAIYGINVSSSGFAGFFDGNVTVEGCLKVGGVQYGTCASDIRLKKNVQSLVGSLEILNKLRPVTYEWIHPEEHGGNTKVQHGFIAQEVEKVIPEWVGIDDRGFKTLDTGGLQIMLVDSVRTLKAENDALKGRVAALESRRTTLSSGGFGLGGLSQFASLGLIVVGGAFVLGRKRGKQDRSQQS